MAHSVRKTVKEHNFHAQTFVTGTRIDDICEKKEIKLKNVSNTVIDLEKERDQLKALNNKLLERVEILQSIIDQEASAHTFYHNYPPKPEE